MGKSKYGIFFPSWVQTLDASLAQERPVVIKAHCPKCGEWREVDLAALREKVGGSYSLVNRRSPCRLTPGCEGWVKFHYLNGVVRPLWDDSAEARWMQMELRAMRSTGEHRPARPDMH